MALLLRSHINAFRALISFTNAFIFSLRSSIFLLQMKRVEERKNEGEDLMRLHVPLSK